MIIKLRSYPAGGRVHTRVFTDLDTGGYKQAGELEFGLGEWQLFGAALLIGQRFMSHHLTIEVEGDAAVIAAFSDTSEMPPDTDVAPF